MQIEGQITGIKYTPIIRDDLPLISFSDFDCNTCPSSCIIAHNNNTFALSKWVSPKRTRSYPYERVYNTLHISKKITVIPIIKDEGKNGDRDFIQWDTISLMSLLDIFVIFAYYIKAEKKHDKITKQQFDNVYIQKKIYEIESYHSSALHWNLNELQNSLANIVTLAENSYKKIGQETLVQMHSETGFKNFHQKIVKDISLFMDFSREKAQQAQAREIQTIQPKEYLQTETKATITITNYLGGKYFFTVDEICVQQNNLFLIEAKHSTNLHLPSKSDVKDGLLKLILYSNLSNVYCDNKIVKTHAELLLTSTKIESEINSISNNQNINLFLQRNSFTEKEQHFIAEIFHEAQVNNFKITIRGSR